MSSSDRRTVLRGLASLAVPALALPACGFTPAYGPTGAASRLQDSILPDAPQTRDQFLLIQRFEERLGRGTDGPYSLSYSYGIGGARSAVTAENVTTRFNYTGTVSFTLRDRATGAELLQGTVEGFTGVSLTGSTSATAAAERDARARLAVLLADKMVTQLIARAASLPA
jgi:LPS-assembly lipoprotein